MRISPTTYRKLYTIDRTVRTIMNICGVVWFVLLFAVVLPTPYRKLFTCGFFAAFGMFVLLGVVRVCFSPFVKSDEEEELEQKVDDILKNRQADGQHLLVEDYSPLHDLTEEQKERFKQLLRDLMPHPDKPDYINLSVVAQYLTALEQSGKATLDDKHNLRLWVIQVTGKNVPASSQFNEAIPSTNKKKVAKARETIERIL